jgi:hypothetical protein
MLAKIISEELILIMVASLLPPQDPKNLRLKIVTRRSPVAVAVATEVMEDMEDTGRNNERARMISLIPIVIQTHVPRRLKYPRRRRGIHSQRRRKSLRR